MKFSHAIFMMVFMYHLSIGYYTAYGVYKSYSEYFCTQRRADSPDYVQLFQGDIIDFSKISKNVIVNEAIIATSTGLYGLKNIGENFDNSTYKYTDNGFYGELNFNYKVKESYFNLNCSIVESFKSNKVLDSNSEYIVDNIQIHYADFDGYLREKKFNKGLVIMVSNYDTLKSFSCTLRKSPETCQLSIESKNKFYITYLIIMVIIILITIMSFFGIESFKVLRVIKIINDKFHFDPKDTLRFCNPITGNPLYLREFSTINLLTNNRYKKPANRSLKSFCDLYGKYTLLDDCVIVESGVERECIEASQDDIRVLSEYFFEITLDPSLCVISLDENHFLKTYEVIQKVCSGKGITKSLKKNNGFVLDVCEFEYKLIRKNYPKLNVELCKLLLEHNWRFFSGQYNMNALLNCLRKKTWFYDRPEDVKNSQWKWYTSDFNKIFEKYNYKSNCQVKWYPSVALKSLDNVDWGNFEIIKMTKTVCKTLEKRFLRKSRRAFVDELNDPTIKINIDDVLQPILSRDVSYSRIEKSVNHELGNDYANALKNYKDICDDLTKHKEKLKYRGWGGKKEEFKDMAEEIKNKVFKYKEVVVNEKKFLENPIYASSQREVKNRFGKVRIIKQKPEMPPMHEEILSNRNSIPEVLINRTVDIAYLINVYKLVDKYEKSLENKEKIKDCEINVQDVVNKYVFDNKMYNRKNRNKNKNNNGNKDRNRNDKNSGKDLTKTKIKREVIFMPKSFITDNFSNCLKALDNKNSGLNIGMKVRQKTLIKLNVIMNKEMFKILEIKNKEFTPELGPVFNETYSKLRNRLNGILAKSKKWNSNIENWDELLIDIDEIINLINLL